MCRFGWSRKLQAEVAVDVFYCGLTPRKDLNDLCRSRVKLLTTRLYREKWTRLRRKRFNVIYLYYNEKLLVRSNTRLNLKCFMSKDQ